MRSSSGAGTTLLSYPYQTIPFKVNTDDADKQLGAVISKNNKPIAFFSRIIINPKCNYNNTDKELLVIVERLKQLLGIIFGYKINIFSDHKKSGLYRNPERISKGDALATNYRRVLAYC